VQFGKFGGIVHVCVISAWRTEPGRTGFRLAIGFAGRIQGRVERMGMETVEEGLGGAGAGIAVDLVAQRRQGQVFCACRTPL